METDIEQVVLHAIQQMLTLYRQKENQKTALQFTRTGRINACMAELTRLQQLQERYRQEKLTLYEGYIAGDCSKERYLKKKAEVDKTVQELDEDVKKQESGFGRSGGGSSYLGKSTAGTEQTVPGYPISYQRNGTGIYSGYLHLSGFAD